MYDSNEEMFPRNWSRFDLDRELSQLTWQQFEDLTELLIRQLHDGTEVLGVNRAGTRAGGVDFVALAETGHVAYQVKTESTVKPSTLRKWVREFIAGPWREKTTQFILLLSRRPSADFLNYYLQYREDVLREHGFELILHDAAWIDERLCDYPSVAGRFFAPAIQLWYEDRVMLARAATEAKARKETSMQRSEVLYDSFIYEDVGVYISANLPNKQHRGVTCLIIMAEPGLYDAMITLGNDDLLRVFEESEWHDGLPFHVAPSGEKHYLQIENVRLLVPRSTVLALAEGVRRLHDIWHERIRALDEERESVGYQIDASAHGVTIGRIDLQMWRVLLEFANAHLPDQAGPFNMFYDHHALLLAPE